jgi:hypothetical protein
MRELTARTALVGVLSWWAVNPMVAHALLQDGSIAEKDASERAEAAVWEWEANLGYGYGVDISSKATFLGDVRFVGLAPRLGRQIGTRPFPDTWLEGRVWLLAETALWVSLEPQRGYAAGATAVARYTFVALDRLRPFVELGAGPIYLDFENDRSQADGFSFTLQAGPGATYPLGSRWALMTRAQLHHISNAGLRRPNPGINDVLITVGIVRRAG